MPISSHVRQLLRTAAQELQGAQRYGAGNWEDLIAELNDVASGGSDRDESSEDESGVVLSPEDASTLRDWVLACRDELLLPASLQTGPLAVSAEGLGQQSVAVLALLPAVDATTETD